MGILSGEIACPVKMPAVHEAGLRRTGDPTGFSFFTDIGRKRGSRLVVRAFPLEEASFKRFGKRLIRQQAEDPVVGGVDQVSSGADTLDCGLQGGAMLAGDVFQLRSGTVTDDQGLVAGTKAVKSTGKAGGVSGAVRVDQAGYFGHSAIRCGINIASLKHRSSD